MSNLQHILRRYAARLLAILLVVALYGLARLPELSKAERGELARNIRFSRLALPEVPGPPPRTSRVVNPSLRHIAAWISSVGAAVALNDLDGDGLPNDACHVDPRTDQVIVAPVPGTPQRYAPFTLDPGAALYDPATMAPMGCLPGQIDDDGAADLIVYYWGRTPVLFLGRKGAGGRPLAAADYAPQEIVPGGERWYTNAATLADLDGDGRLDLVLGNYFGDGSRILDARATTAEEMQHSMTRAFNGGGVRLLRGEGAAAHFRVVEGAVEGGRNVSRGWVLAAAANDLDGDLLPELYLAHDFGPDRLLSNRSKPGEFRFVPLEGTRSFTTPTSKVLGRDGFKGMGVDFADLNGDGVPDIFVSNITDEYALEESNFAFISTGGAADEIRRGRAPYVDRSESLGLSRSGWAWDIKLADLTNSGRLEVLQATGFSKGAVNRWAELHELAMGSDQLTHHPASWPRFTPGDACISCSGHNHIFTLAEDGRYYDIASELGLDAPHISRGIATADVDGDGRLDVAVANQYEQSYFLRNESAAVGDFLGLHLRLAADSPETKVSRGHGADASGRPAVGATARVVLPHGRSLTAQVDGGNGHSGKRSPDLHFGLGRAYARGAKIRVDLGWRDRRGEVRRQTLEFDGPGWYTVVLASREG
jgi:hypothetical protein